MTMTVPAVSVVVPVYNRLDLVRPVLDAFAAQQSTMPFEVIVVDDGSDPPAATVVAGRDDRFRLLVQANRGRSGAINTGLSATRGEIVIICDADIVPTGEFIEEHLAFHRAHPAIEDTHLGEVTWGLTPPPVAALFGPRANPRMVGLTGRVPWTLWYTDNWSFKRPLIEAGLVHFDENFQACYWEDLELARRLEARGIRNQATGSARGRHLQCRSLDERLQVFSRSVPNLLHLANCIEHDDAISDWLVHRQTSRALVETGESILRQVFASIETVTDRLTELDPSLIRTLSISLSDAVFRCGMQRGFVELQGISVELDPQELAAITMLPHADLVQVAIIVLMETGQADAARALLDFSRGKVAEICGAPDLVSRFIRRAMPGRPTIVRTEH